MYSVEIFEIFKETSTCTDLIDITPDILKKVRESGIKQGSALVFVQGSTASVSTIEYEGGVLADFKKIIGELVPEDMNYKHDQKWKDGNGYSHVRACLMGPSLTIPINKGELLLGTWQQVVLIDFDNRPRKRKILLQLSGNKE